MGMIMSKFNTQSLLSHNVAEQFELNALSCEWISLSCGSSIMRRAQIILHFIFYIINKIIFIYFLYSIATDMSHCAGWFEIKLSFMSDVYFLFFLFVCLFNLSFFFFWTCKCNTAALKWEQKCWTLLTLEQILCRNGCRLPPSGEVHHCRLKHKYNLASIANLQQS